MILGMFKTAVCMGTIILLTACLKLQVNADGVVEDTVSAGKSLYTTIKHKKDGTEERVYTPSIELASETDEQQAGKECLEYLTKTMDVNADKKPQILETSTEIIKADSGNTLKCSIRAVV